MANSIALFKKYTDMLDEVYQNASKTAILETSSSVVRAGNNANEIIIPKISMSGLGNYSRSSGYVTGDVTLTNETVTFNTDRGRKFQIDAMDNEETAGISFGMLSAEFIRTKVVPEFDAMRFATYAGISGISTVTGATLADGAAVLAALQVAQGTMDDDEVPESDRHLFITSANLIAVQSVDTTTSREVMASFASITKVPQARFYTAIDLYDGTTDGEKAGGYVKSAGAADINFMVIHKPAVIQFTKHLVNKVFTPEENQSADAWIFPYRAYALTDVYENKVAGIYLHKKAVE